MDYEIQFARLATQDKLPDRFLNTQFKSSTDLSKTTMGEIFTMVEILTPWFTTSQIGQTIINTFAESYWNGGSTSDLVNFENALKDVNKKLGQITQNGETEWLGNLNSILGVIVGNKIHLAQAGKAQAYVFRDGKINHLTEGLDDNANEPHPLSTYSNITSGELKLHDKLVIANPEVYNHLGLENLRQIITMTNPSSGIIQIAKLLKKKRIIGANMLVLNLLTSDEIAKTNLTEEPDTIYLDKPLESLWFRVTKVWQGLIYPILKFVAKKRKKSWRKLLNVH